MLLQWAALRILRHEDIADSPVHMIDDTVAYVRHEAYMKVFSAEAPAAWLDILPELIIDATVRRLVVARYKPNGSSQLCAAAAAADVDK